jgi:hypothetical protein
MTSISAWVKSSADHGIGMRIIFAEFHSRAMWSALRKM